MKIKFDIGLKLWSTNEQYVRHAADLHREGVYDFIELYAVPGSLAQFGKLWKETNIPVRLHAPHELNLSRRELSERNDKLSTELVEFCKFFEAETVIVHPGIDGNQMEAIRQVLLVHEKISRQTSTKLLVENMPFIGVKDEICQGADFKDIRELVKASESGFCFDVGHATKTAIHLKQDVKAYLNLFTSLKPDVVHVSDGHLNTVYDEHMSIGSGEYDFNFIGSLIHTLNPQCVVLEVARQSKENLNEFKTDALVIKKILTETSSIKEHV